MSSTTILTGNLTADPTLRQCEDRPVCTFRLASHHRYCDTTTGEWKNRDTLFIDVTCWGTLATNVAQSLSKGQSVIVSGRLRTEEFVPRGSERPVTVISLIAQTVGPDLRYSAVEVQKRSEKTEEDKKM